MMFLPLRRALGLASFVSASLLIAPLAQAETKVDLSSENTEVKFVGTKPNDKHEGGFKNVSGRFVIPGEDLSTAKLEVEIDVDSVYSDNDKLTAHLKSPDFFSVKTYPKAKFVSKSITKTDSGKYKIIGDFTLVGKTNPLSFEADITCTEGQVCLMSDFKINRHDYGISYGKGKIDDMVSLSVAVKCTK